MGGGTSRDGAFVGFVAARSGHLLAHAELLCGDRHQAEDIVQTVLARGYRRWAVIEQEDPYGYFLRAVTNAVTDWWRLAYRRRERASAVLPDRPGPESAATWEDRDVLLAALARLSVRERAVVVLRYLEDRTEAQTAELLGVSVGTVKSSTHRALGKLRIELAEEATCAPRRT